MINATGSTEMIIAVLIQGNTAILITRTLNLNL